MGGFAGGRQMLQESGRFRPEGGGETECSS